MPQIENVDKFCKYMKDKHGVVNVSLGMDPKDLTPTQKEFNSEKVVSMIKDRNYFSKPLLVDKDGKILDGHHRWLAALAEKKETIKCRKFSCDVEELLEKAKGYSFSTFKKLSETPWIDYGNDHFDLEIEKHTKDPSKVVQMIQAILKGKKYKDKHGNEIALRDKKSRKAFLDSLEDDFIFQQFVSHVLKQRPKFLSEKLENTMWYGSSYKRFFGLYVPIDPSKIEGTVVRRFHVASFSNFEKLVKLQGKSVTISTMKDVSLRAVREGISESGSSNLVIDLRGRKLFSMDKDLATETDENGQRWIPLLIFPSDIRVKLEKELEATQKIISREYVLPSNENPSSAPDNRFKTWKEQVEHMRKRYMELVYNSIKFHEKDLKSFFGGRERDPRVNKSDTWDETLLTDFKIEQVLVIDKLADFSNTFFMTIKGESFDANKVEKDVMKVSKDAKRQAMPLAGQIAFAFDKRQPQGLMRRIEEVLEGHGLTVIQNRMIDPLKMIVGIYKPLVAKASVREMYIKKGYTKKFPTMFYDTSDVYSKDMEKEIAKFIEAN